MLVGNFPMVNSKFQTSQGDTFVVIGRGTHGVIIEYIDDGRVELLSLSQWIDMSQKPLIKILH